MLRNPLHSFVEAPIVGGTADLHGTGRQAGGARSTGTTRHEAASSALAQVSRRKEALADVIFLAARSTAAETGPDRVRPATTVD
ncbi:hypothetical protein [Streptomyces sp. NPDC058872]|uniref:hypothetical protein n=1 Tax=Streptomyces sp. NPDC058872 TaxID=3346661 RepID=UPI0036BEF5CC